MVFPGIRVSSKVREQGSGTVFERKKAVLCFLTQVWHIRLWHEFRKEKRFDKFEKTPSPIELDCVQYTRATKNSRNGTAQ